MRLANHDDPSSSPQKCRRRWQLLKHYLASNGIGAELGTFKGNFVEYLLQTRPRRLYLVDPWYRAASRWKWARGSDSTVAALQGILTEYRQEIDARVIEPRVEFSEEFLERVPDRSLDWVYLDTTHDYASTARELALCARKVKSGGVIAGDDYEANPEHKHHGVYVAVRELRDSGAGALVVDGDARQFALRVT